MGVVRRGLRVVALASLGVAGGVAVNQILDGGIWDWRWIVAALTFGIGLKVLETWLGRIDAPGEPVEQALRHLKTVTRQEAARQAAERDLGPHSLDVSWRSDAEGAAAGTPDGLEGRLSDLHQVFLARRPRRMILLGDAGAGKSASALLLTLRLLDTDGPVPVLLEAAPWSPPAGPPGSGESLLDWCASRVSEMLPAVEAGERRSLARGLLTEGRIVPVLDGLDEIFGGVDARTVRALNQAVVEIPGFLLTCRPAEFTRAVAEAGVAVADTTVVRLQPLGIKEITGYLTAGRVSGDTHWDGVIEALGRAPDGPLARVLSVPLMAWLARVVYTPMDTDPDELRASGLDRAALENLLFTRYFPAVYRSPGSGLRRYDAERATAWLGLLAGQLEVTQSQDWTWRRLDTIVRPSRTGALIGSAVTILWWAALALGHTLPPDIKDGYPLDVTPPRWLTWLGDYPFVPFVALYGWAILGFAVPPKIRRWSAAILSRVPWLIRTGRNVAVGLVMGMFQMVFLMFAVVTPSMMFGPAVRELVPGLPSPGGFVAGAGVLGGVTAVCVFNQWVVRGGNDRTGFGDELHLLDSRSPRLAVRQARRDFLVSAGFLTAVLTPVTIGFWGAPRGLAAAVLIVCVMSLAAHVWPYYLAARLRLALGGHLPWRLLRFLDDAHARGVLRRPGPSYQFRHARLQTHLAAAFPQRLTTWSEVSTRHGRHSGRKS
ncbi:NACHT domain-containing protein [Streptosporangium sp. NPDC002721]|uniref:NACHT domain-containing protein n=1 Tax=Streptosporangium sp. NPDC002721 TaxID=3366188 RepID=UPI0036751086